MPYYHLTLEQGARRLYRAEATIEAATLADAEAVVAGARDFWTALARLPRETPVTEADQSGDLDVTVVLERDPNQLDWLG